MSNLRIALWEVSSDNPNSPKFNGIVTIDGTEHKISLWDNSNASHPKAPKFKGKTSKPSPKVFTPVETADISFALPF